MNAMSLGPYAIFIVTSYMLVAAIVAMLIAGSRSTIAARSAGCTNLKPAASKDAPGAAQRN